MSERAPRTQVIEETLPASTILATTDQSIGEAREAGVIVGATYTPEAAITGAASPASRTLTIINKGQAGLGAVVMATLAFLAAVDGVAFDEKAFTLTATVADRAVVAGDILAVVSAPVGGTGLVDPGGRVQVELGRSA